MEIPSSKVIEITVISAEDLLLRRKQPATKNLSVTVSIDPFNSRKTGRADPNGPGRFPAWNERLVMDLPSKSRFITTEVRAGERTVGVANIPVADFDGGHLPENYLSFLSYRLRDGRGEKNGIVNLSVRVVGGGGRGCGASCPRPWMEFSAADGKGSSGVVTGIPVLYRY
ncbi:BON1-associated protein 2 [Striga hermonthica]|uniref:BON1-associated protein 2 n=1 Tax=Striga hermonthica TaxID=68872 RepID=A0A9N7P352_STRHE|nr:BON1-associated protein 2 [Striga hermonthica]